MLSRILSLCILTDVVALERSVTRCATMEYSPLERVHYTVEVTTSLTAFQLEGSIGGIGRRIEVCRANYMHSLDVSK